MKVRLEDILRELLFSVVFMGREGVGEERSGNGDDRDI